jgi:hypothetical protein
LFVRLDRRKIPYLTPWPRAVWVTSSAWTLIDLVGPQHSVLTPVLRNRVKASARAAVRPGCTRLPGVRVPCTRVCRGRKPAARGLLTPSTTRTGAAHGARIRRLANSTRRSYARCSTTVRLRLLQLRRSFPLTDEASLPTGTPVWSLGPSATHHSRVVPLLKDFGDR